MAYGRGHCRGHKKEKKGSQDWYGPIAEEWIKKIEAEWETKQQPVKK
jgi:hypothetical protein